ncbi:MAG: 50S ribosomal protein L21 [Patescibacteria group bacterium]|nr:50S ribosomal protein L21 [Patescibacteria group bacterium]
MKNAFVVIEIGGTQHIVSVGDNIDVNRVEGDVGDNIEIDKVYLLQSDQKTEIGSPELPYVVTAEILEQYKAKKIEVRKFKAKARYRRKYGHRQHMTKLKVTKISAKKVGAKKVAVKKAGVKKATVKKGGVKKTAAKSKSTKSVSVKKTPRK